MRRRSGARKIEPRKQLEGEPRLLSKICRLKQRKKMSDRFSEHMVNFALSVFRRNLIAPLEVLLLRILSLLERQRMHWRHSRTHIYSVADWCLSLLQKILSMRKKRLRKCRRKSVDRSTKWRCKNLPVAAERN